MCHKTWTDFIHATIKSNSCATTYDKLIWNELVVEAEKFNRNEHELKAELDVASRIYLEHHLAVMCSCE